MSKINSIYSTIYRPIAALIATGATPALGTIRKQFIHDVTTHTGDLKMSKAGAASYYNLCKRRAENKDMYASHKKYNASQTAKPAAPEIDMSNRWLVGNKEASTVFASFTTRTAAQSHNKQLTSEGIASNWIDSTKVDASTFTPSFAS